LSPAQRRPRPGGRGRTGFAGGRAMGAVMDSLPEHFNFTRFLIERNATREARIAYRDDTRTLSYGDLHDAVRRCAGLLRGAGLKREERVLLLMHDNVDWPVAFLGALYAG